MRYTRRNALTPVLEIDEWEELDEHLAAWLAQEDQRRPAGRQRSIGELWEDEPAGLIPLPHHPFDSAKPETRKVSAHSLISFKTNRYSVPVKLVGAQVTVKSYAKRIEVHGPGGKVAEHPRLYGRHQTSFVLEHYLDLHEWKPRTFDRAAPVKEAQSKWPPAYRVLLEVLRSRRGEDQGTRAFIEVPWLHKHHGAEAVHAAVRHALTHPEASPAAVLAYLDIGRRADAPQESLSGDDLSNYPDAKVHDKDADDYDQLRFGSRRSE